MTYLEFQQQFLESVSHLYEINEAKAMWRWYVHDRWKIPPYQFVLKLHEDAPSIEHWKEDLEQLRQGTPLQYVLGTTDFYGHSFRVDARALIPRPETEELVDIIVKENQHRKHLRILDIGTGSGCIAISLALSLPEAIVTAVDISQEALLLAQENAALHQVNILWQQMDILSISYLSSCYDIIVSNPPYIPVSIKNALHRNVVNYEPAIALFVPDEQPLIFYQKIAFLAASSLVNGGKLYFETYENYHSEISQILEKQNFIEIKMSKDSFQRQRFVSCKKSSLL